MEIIKTQEAKAVLLATIKTQEEQIQTGIAALQLELMTTMKMMKIMIIESSVFFLSLMTLMMMITILRIITAQVALLEARKEVQMVLTIVI